MGLGDRRKCKCCLKLFHPDPRNRRHQRYCSARACRAASKTASQARWRVPCGAAGCRLGASLVRYSGWEALAVTPGLRLAGKPAAPEDLASLASYVARRFVPLGH
jgi:hypothetical protein